jgi:hypothetical protein
LGAEVSVNSGCNYDGTVESCGTGIVDAMNPLSFPSPLQSLLPTTSPNSAARRITHVAIISFHNLPLNGNKFPPSTLSIQLCNKVPYCCWWVTYIKDEETVHSRLSTL